MGVLVEELLLLARLDEGRPLKREPVDLAQVAADAVADARITDPGRAIDLAATDPVVLQGDEVRLRQVAANLVMNALTHAGPEAHVHVGARAHDGWAELEVSDDGVGMSPEVAEHVFEPFFHADGEPDDESSTGTARPRPSARPASASPSPSASPRRTGGASISRRRPGTAPASSCVCLSHGGAGGAGRREPMRAQQPDRRTHPTRGSSDTSCGPCPGRRRPRRAPHRRGATPARPLRGRARASRALGIGLAQPAVQEVVDRRPYPRRQRLVVGAGQGLLPEHVAAHGEAEELRRRRAGREGRRRSTGPPRRRGG